MMAYSDRKDHLTAEELANFLRNEQKVRGHTVLRLEPIKCSGDDVKPHSFFYDQVSKLHPQKRDISVLPLLSLTRICLCLSRLPRGISAPLSESITPKIGLSHGCPFIAVCSFSLLRFCQGFSLCFRHTLLFLTQQWCHFSSRYIYRLLRAMLDIYTVPTVLLA